MTHRCEAPGRRVVHSVCHVGVLLLVSGLSPREGRVRPRPSPLGRHRRHVERPEYPVDQRLFTAAGLALSAAKQVQRGLLFYDDKDEFTGELAEEVPSLKNGGISQDRRSITYKLRKNVKWHDGKPVTSADVRFTWQAIMNPTSKVVSRYGYDQIDTVDTPDHYTVVVRFKKPFAPWAILFDAIVPKHLLENEARLAESAFNRKPIGFGPMKFVEWVSGDHITWEATPTTSGAPPGSIGSSCGSSRAPRRS